jgi:hypothetical protein
MFALPQTIPQPPLCVIQFCDLVLHRANSHLEPRVRAISVNNHRDTIVYRGRAERWMWVHLSGYATPEYLDDHASVPQERLVTLSMSLTFKQRGLNRALHEPDRFPEPGKAIALYIGGDRASPCIYGVTPNFQRIPIGAPQQEARLAIWFFFVLQAKNYTTKLRTIRYPA